MPKTFTCLLLVGYYHHVIVVRAHLLGKLINGGGSWSKERVPSILAITGAWEGVVPPVKMSRRSANVFGARASFYSCLTRWKHGFDYRADSVDGTDDEHAVRSG